MLKHVVLAKFKPGVTAADIAELKRSLASLPGIIPEIKGYDFGEDSGRRGPSISRWFRPSRMPRR